MKLLLDEMWPPAIAVQLRHQGYDVVAVAERPELRGQPDAIIFAAAQADGRSIVTENVADYRLLAAVELRQSRSHAGLFFTSDRRFPRHDPRTAGRLVTALIEIASRTLDPDGFEYWLR